MGSSYVSYLHLVDLLEVIESVCPVDRDEITTDEVIERGRHALDAPAAERRGESQNREVFPTLGEKAAVLCGCLLAEPPLLDEAGKIAFGCLERFLFCNGARWEESPRTTVFRFNEAIQNPGLIEELREWIPRWIEETPPSSRVARQPELFGHLRQPPTVVLLSGSPEQGKTAPGGTPESVGDTVEGALRAAAARTYEPCEIRLEHPSARIPRLVDGGGEGGNGQRDFWEYTSRLIVDQVDAMIAVDVLLDGAGFGATPDLDLHLAQDGPVLYLHRAGSTPSRFLSGRAEEVDMDILEYEDLSEVGPMVSDWVVWRWPAIRTASRRRHDRAIQYRPVKKRLEIAWRRSRDERREIAADAAGMTLQAVNRALTSAALVAVLPAHRLDALCRTLGVATPRMPGRRRKQDADTAPNFGALLEAAEENDWPRATIFTLFNEARGIGPRQYVTRPDWRNKEDWIRRRDALGG